jgi:maintenance of mitochondrial morphology protein 1
MGTRARLQDVPKIAQLVEARIHAWLDDRCVEPRYQEIVLPNLWPRKSNTRGGDGAIDDDEDDYAAEAGAERHSSTPTGKTETPPSNLEERMAAEGRKLLAAEGRAGESSMRQRPLRQASHENYQIPGKFV